MAKGAFAAGNYLKLTTLPVTTWPLSMFCAFYPLSATQGRLMRIGTTGTSGYWGLQHLASQVLAADTLNNGGSGSGNPQTVNTSTLNAWNYATVVFNASNDRSLYLNSGSVATSTANATPVTPTQLNVGINGDLSTPFDGYIQDAAIWDIALTAADVAMLHQGISPELVRPENLQFYTPLIRGLQNLAGPIIAETGTVPVQPHNRVIYSVGNNDGIGNNE